MDNSWPNEVYSLVSNESIRQMSKKQRTDQPGNRHGKIVIHCFKGEHNSPQELAVIEAISILSKTTWLSLKLWLVMMSKQKEWIRSSLWIDYEIETFT